MSRSRLSPRICRRTWACSATSTTRVVVERARALAGEPDLEDAIQSLLRLAPDARAEALRRAGKVAGEFGEALRHALGGKVRAIGPTAALWVAAARARERAVREGGERLDDPDERDPNCIVRVTVAVRVDGGLEPCEELIGAAVDRDPAVGVGLPPGHADGKQRDPRCHPAQPGRAARTGDEPGDHTDHPTEQRPDPHGHQAPQRDP